MSKLTCTRDYTTMLSRLFRAARRLDGPTAAVVGMHWERWARDREFARFHGGR